MRFGGILISLGWGGLFLSGLMLLPALWAFFIDHPYESVKFFLTALFVLFISGAMIFTGRGGTKERLRKSEIYLLAPLAYIFLGFLGGIPMIGMGGGLSFSQAFFEGVSALTTTGASVYVNPEFQSEALLLWRGVLAWFGGILILTFAVSVFTSFGIGGVKVKAVLVRQNENETLPQRLKRSMKYVFLPYLFFSVAGFIGFILSGLPIFDALSLTFSSISTTGFVTYASPLYDRLPAFALFTLNLLMLIGALGYPLHQALMVGRFRELNKDPELKPFLALALILMLVLFLAVPNTRLGEALTLAISLITTTALPIHHSAHAGAGISLLFYFIPVAIGGLALSTAGGLKFLRIIILLQHIWRQMSILPYQHAVEHFKFGDRHVEIEQVKEIWAFFVLFLCAFAFVLIGSAFIFSDFEQMWIATLSAITNAGGLAMIAGAPSLYADMSSFGHIFMALVMIIGRLELLVVLVLINPAYWRSGI